MPDTDKKKGELERQLDETEVRAIREMAREWERYKWAWAVVRRIAYWIAGVIAAVWMIREPLGKVFKALGS